MKKNYFNIKEQINLQNLIQKYGKVDDTGVVLLPFEYKLYNLPKNAKNAVFRNGTFFWEK